MTSTPTPNPKADRRDRLLFVGILFLLIAAAITTGRLIATRRHQALLARRPLPDARHPKFHLYDVRYGVRIDSPAAAARAQGKRSEYLAKAQTLRDHWRVWAVKHQDLLRQLRQAPPDDTATLGRVYAALPSSAHLNQATGVTLADIAVAPDDILGQRHLQFTWQIAPLKSHLSPQLRGEPNAQATSDKYDSASQQKLLRDFADYHSIMLSESMCDGYSRVTLWADGQITELARHAKLDMDEPDVADGPEQEMAPAYDFLK